MSLFSSTTGAGAAIFSLRFFGDEDVFVIVVLAVPGLSPNAVAIAALDEAGSLPMTSKLLILDFKSSSSSQSVEGALVDVVDSESAG